MAAYKAQARENGDSCYLHPSDSHAGIHRRRPSRGKGIPVTVLSRTLLPLPLLLKHHIFRLGACLSGADGTAS